MKKIEKREVEIIPCDLLERESNNGGMRENRERKEREDVRSQGKKKGCARSI
jgi:hypothetical protein